MSSESEMLRWKGEGLPADGLSMQVSACVGYNGVWIVWGRTV